MCHKCVDTLVDFCKEAPPLSSRRGDDPADPSDDKEFNVMDEDSDSDDDDGILQVFTPPKPKPASKRKLSAKRKPTAKKAQQLFKKGGHAVRAAVARKGASGMTATRTPSSKKRAHAKTPIGWQPPKKKKDSELYSHFQITILECGSVSIICLHCSLYNCVLQQFNPTKGRDHLINVCPGVGDDVKTNLMKGSQRFKRH